MTDRVVLVTGAGSGIGAVIAAQAAALGDRVVVTDVDAAAATRISAQLPRSVAMTLDVTSGEQVRAVVARIAREVGPVQVLVNNAGVASDVPFGRLPEELWHRDIAAGGGAIVNVASVNGLTYLGNEAYSAAKAGLISLTKSIAVRYGDRGIRCNAVAPGTIATPIWQQRMEADPMVMQRAARWYPLGRVGRPEDVAAAVLFLAGDGASWITGVTLPVDGGLLAGRLAMADEIVSSVESFEPGPQDEDR
jgi:meso-butanediol dehydrogenase/(S,S)-butanediol dehydrogenase/diacetyl reductase